MGDALLGSNGVDISKAALRSGKGVGFGFTQSEIATVLRNSLY